MHIVSNMLEYFWLNTKYTNLFNDKDKILNELASIFISPWLL